MSDERARPASEPDTGAARLTERDLLRLRVLDELERTANVSQRALAEGLGLTATRLNRLIRDLRSDGHVEVVDRDVRPFAYRLTDDGRAHRQRLEHRHYRAVMGGFRLLKDRIRRRMSELGEAGGDRVLVVGAGRAARGLLADTAFRTEAGEVVGLLDDDPARLDAPVRGLPVLAHTDELEDLVRAFAVGRVILALPTAPERKVRDLARRARFAGARVERVPALHERVRRDEAGAAAPSGVAPSELRPVEPGGREAPDEPDPGARETGRVLVTGGAGYIGAHLVRRLLEEGFPVRVLDTLTRGRRGLEAVATHPALEIVEGDVHNLRHVVASIRGVETVIALAPLAGTGDAGPSPGGTPELSWESMRILVDAANFEGVRRLVLASSLEVYGPGDGSPLDETSEIAPAGPRATAHAYAEGLLLERTKRTDDAEAVILRLATCFGLSPRMRWNLPVNRWTARAATEGTIEVEDGGRPMALVHCRDAAEAFLLAAMAPAEKVAGEAFNVGSEALCLRARDAAQAVLEAMPGTEVRWGEAGDGGRERPVFFGKIRSRLGFEATRDLAEGVREMKEALEEGEAIGAATPLNRRLRRPPDEAGDVFLGGPETQEGADQ